MSAADAWSRLRRGLAALLVGVLAASGCALFGPLDEHPVKVEANRPLLPAIRPAVDAVQLQIVFVERPLGDPLLNQLLWQELDLVGAAPPAMRAVLQDNGFRLGQAGSSPPPTLETLLGLKAEVADNLDGDERLMRGRRLGLRSGQETEVEINEQAADCVIRFRGDGKDDLQEYTQARCVLRLKPVRLQDGWVRIDLTPEVHHGDSRMRHTPTAEGWALRGGQNTDIRHALKFSVKLSTGEFAVIGCDVAEEDLAGRAFFTRTAENSSRMQRALVIRLADAGQSTPAEAAPRP